MQTLTTENEPNRFTLLLSKEKLARAIIKSAIEKVEELGFRMKVCQFDNNHGGKIRLDLRSGRVAFYHPDKH